MKTLKKKERSIWSNASFKAIVSLLIFYLDDLSTDVSEVLRSSSIIVLLSVPPFMFVSICFMCLDTPVGVCMYVCVLFCLLGGLIPLSLCNIFVSFYSLCFKVYFVWYKDCYHQSLFMSVCMVWNTLFHPLTFSLCVTAVKWVSCRQHVYGSCCFYPFSHPIFWIGTFIPFTFKVIIDRYVLTAILLVVFWLFLLFFCVPFFSCDLVTIFTVNVCITSSLFLCI